MITDPHGMKTAIDMGSEAGDFFDEAEIDPEIVEMVNAMAPKGAVTR